MEWWFDYLTESQRTRLMREVDQPLDPDLALELWRHSGMVRVVEPAQPTAPFDPNTWRLTDEVVRFVRARALEQRDRDQR